MLFFYGYFALPADFVQLCADIIVRSCAIIFDAVFRTQSCNNHFVNDVKEKSIDFGRQTHVDWVPKAKSLPSKLYEFAWAGATIPPRALRLGRQTVGIQKCGMGIHEEAPETKFREPRV